MARSLGVGVWRPCLVLLWIWLIWLMTIIIWYNWFNYRIYIYLCFYSDWYIIYLYLLICAHHMYICACTYGNIMIYIWYIIYTKVACYVVCTEVAPCLVRQSHLALLGLGSSQSNLCLGRSAESHHRRSWAKKWSGCMNRRNAGAIRCLHTLKSPSSSGRENL